MTREKTAEFSYRIRIIVAHLGNGDIITLLHFFAQKKSSFDSYSRLLGGFCFIKRRSQRKRQTIGNPQLSAADRAPSQSNAYYTVLAASVKWCWFAG